MGLVKGDNFYLLVIILWLLMFFLHILAHLVKNVDYSACMTAHENDISAAAILVFAPGLSVLTPLLTYLQLLSLSVSPCLQYVSIISSFSPLSAAI